LDRIGTGFLNAEATADSTKEIVFLAPASPAVTANGNTAGADVSSYTEALLFVDVTAVSGTTPTMNLYVDTYDFNSGQWYPVPSVAIAQQTAVGTLDVALTNFGEQIRLRWVVGGTTPSFTFQASVVPKSH
jgi:hypothetical protein